MPNDVKLQEGHPVDENLRPIKVGGKLTAIETAQYGNGARISGELLVTGDIKGDVANLNTINSSSLLINSSAGFSLATPSYDATDTVVNFKISNKQMVTFGSGNITNIQLHFPTISGNFVALLKQDGTGSRTITNYKAFDADGNAAAGFAGVKFAGGSNPTLTTDANHVDIISFFWDADNEIAYGVPTLDFQF